MRDFYRSRICKVNDIFLIFIAYFVPYTEKEMFDEKEMTSCDNKNGNGNQLWERHGDDS